jgi:DNA repair protein RadC
MDGDSVLGNIFRQILKRSFLSIINSYLDPSKIGPAPSSKELWSVLQSIFKDLDAEKEHFVLLVLDHKNTVIGFKVISNGTPTNCPADPRKIYGAVLAPEWEAEAIVFSHNHPAGNPKPSEDDEELTRRLMAIGALLGIKVWDHIIMGHERFFSFADNGLL